MERRRLVSVIGDAEVVEGDAAYDEAREVGRRLVDAGYRVVTGGLGGVMEAACRGARESEHYREGDTLGILPRLEAQEANPYVDIAITTSLEHGRNLIVASSDAVVAIGGGAGTLAEIAFAWLYHRVIVALTTAEGWSRQLAGARLDTRPGDLHRAETPEEVIATLRARVPAR